MECELCFNQWNSENRIPKILPCGHSYCIQCLTNLLDSYKKNFQSKIENVAKNFQLCIDLLGNDKNVNVQEMACQCLVFILQFFPGSNIESLKMKLNFKPDDIPKLLKGLELSCYKIHKRMIQLFIWIIEFQNDGKKILKPYLN